MTKIDIGTKLGFKFRSEMTGYEFYDWCDYIRTDPTYSPYLSCLEGENKIMWRKLETGKWDYLLLD
jgi:hypothetical protein